MNQPLIPIRTAAQQTGLAIDTIRAWERRYQAVVPTRTKGGRLFSEADVKRLTLLKKGVEAGYNIGQIAGLSQAELEISFGESAHFLDTNPEVTLDFRHHQFLKFIQAYDAVGADSALGKLAALLGPKQFCFEILIPLMSKVGDAWHNGQINMAQEHMASNIMRSLVGTLLRMHQPSAQAPKALCSSPSGEFHEFGILAAALVLLSSGYLPIYLGPNLPAREIEEAVRQTDAEILVLGVRPNAEISQDSLGDITVLRQNLGPEVAIFVGGGLNQEALLKDFARQGIFYPKDFHAFEKALVEWRSQESS